ncbi:MAG: hypothetical protein LBD24_09740 [Spirochaetaceae bacterium]|nr:hypothetical protein [Spirochaetaceae bacterium]
MKHTRGAAGIIALAGLLLICGGCQGILEQVLANAPTHGTGRTGGGGQAVVVVQRADGAGGGSDKMEVFIDGELRLSLGNGEEGRVSVPNGKHTLYAAVNGEPKSQHLSFTAKSDQLTFILSGGGGGGEVAIESGGSAPLEQPPAATPEQGTPPVAAAPDTGSGTNYATGSGKEGVYIGILSFAPNAEDITGGSPVYLDDAGYAQLQSALDTRYKKVGAQGTSLYYAVHKGLANLTGSASKFPSNLESVNLLIFTDGLDNNSTSLALQTIEGQDFGGRPVNDYLAYITKEIPRRKIGGKSIVSYSAGVKGNDVNDAEAFTRSLRALASDPQNNFFELSNFSQLNAKFAEIANRLTVITRDINFDVMTPSYPVGTRVRMTFDVPKGKSDSASAAASKRYLQGEVTLSSNRRYVLTNLSYSGLSSAVGGTVTGVMDGTEVTYKFEGLQGYDPKTTPNDMIQQWSMASDSKIWQINSEYRVGNAVKETVEKKSTIIYMVLDSSNSLSDSDVIAIRDSAKGFVKTLYDKTR